MIVLSSRDYWKRLWIIQEVLLARYLVICCGNSLILWQHFGQLLYDTSATILHSIGYRSMGGHTESYSPNTNESYPTQISMRRSNPAQGKSVMFKSWREAIGFSQHSLCEDRRDRIYGVLALIEQPLTITPDYSKDIKDLLWEVFWVDAPQVHLDNFIETTQFFRFGHTVRATLGLEDSITNNEIDLNIASKFGRTYINFADNVRKDVLIVLLERYIEKQKETWTCILCCFFPPVEEYFLQLQLILGLQDSITKRQSRLLLNSYHYCESESPRQHGGASGEKEVKRFRPGTLYKAALIQSLEMWMNLHEEPVRENLQEISRQLDKPILWTKD